MTNSHDGGQTGIDIAGAKVPTTSSMAIESFLVRPLYQSAANIFNGQKNLTSRNRQKDY